MFLYILIYGFLYSIYYYKNYILYNLLKMYNKINISNDNFNNNLNIEYIDSNNNLSSVDLDTNKYIIINKNNKKIIYKLIHQKSSIICANLNIDEHNLKIDFTKEINNFIIYNCNLDLYKLKDVWISLINNKYNTNLNLNTNINWEIITESIDTYKGDKLIINVCNGIIKIN